MINVMDMKSGTNVEGDSGVSWVKYSDISWYKDYGFFYSTYKEPSNRPPMDGKAGVETDALENQILCFHRIGTHES
jgi:prolyl oligopeptidase